MNFNKNFYMVEFKRLSKERSTKKFYIKKSSASFKIKSFIRKGINSFELANYVKNSRQNAKDYWTITICYYSMLYMAKAAILTKGYETDDHYATQIALGRLLMPDEIEKEDLELLGQAHKIFEEDYINYFEDARTESSTSRYSATKIYTERRVNEILENARRFVAKLKIVIGT